MSNAEFPSNSNPEVPPRRPVEKPSEKPATPPRAKRVTTSTAKQRKRPLGKRILETFTNDDAQGVGHYILFEVVIPATKSLIVDAATTGVERIFWGDSRPNTRRSGSGRSSYTPYGSASSSRGRAFEPDGPRREMSRGARRAHNFDEIILDDRGEAERVLQDLQAIIDQYDVAKVSDLYEMVGITGSYTDDKWGWFDLSQSGIRRISGGEYLLDLPRTQPID